MPGKRENTHTHAHASPPFALLRARGNRRPPELITDGLMTRAGDVYAFGVVMWELYMGQRAWAGLKANQVLGAVASKHMLAYPDYTPKRLKVSAAVRAGLPLMCGHAGDWVLPWPVRARVCLNRRIKGETPPRWLRLGVARGSGA